MSETALPGAKSYPVTYEVDPQLTERNRATVAVRIILAIPHLLLVGGPGGTGYSFAFGWGRDSGNGFAGAGGGGVLGAVACVMSIISWFAIVFTGKQPKGLWDFSAFYLRWRAKAVAYMALLRDEYPPFGEGDYPVRFDLGTMPEARDRLSVALRLIFVIPHAIVLFFVGIAWAISVVIGWFAVLFTGAYPESLYNFGIGYLRWSLRVESYVLLMHDEYPPFSLD